MVNTLKDVKTVLKCRICGSSTLEDFFDMGRLPLPNAFLTKEELQKSEKRYPLVVCFCHDCCLVQLRFVVDPEIIFRNYLYLSSSSETRKKDYRDFSQEISLRFNLQPSSLIVDIGSNNGMFLSSFKDLGIRVLGIEPAINLRAIAENNGVPTISDFFTNALVKDIINTNGKASLITATNVFAHIENVIDTMNAVDNLLERDGIFITQFPYLLDLLHKRQFDTIYHEHLSYFSLKPLLHLTKLTNFDIFDVQKSNLDGGSLRVFWKKKENKKWQQENDTIAFLTIAEKHNELYKIETYKNFADHIQHHKRDLLDLLQKFKQNNKSIVGYGAPAKGTILLNYLKIDKNIINYVVDSTLYKQGLFVPGTSLEVFPEDKIYQDKPNYLLVLAWNFAEEIIEKNRLYKSIGKFILPIPTISVI